MPAISGKAVALSSRRPLPTDHAVLPDPPIPSSLYTHGEWALKIYSIATFRQLPQENRPGCALQGAEALPERWSSDAVAVRVDLPQLPAEVLPDLQVVGPRGGHQVVPLAELRRSLPLLQQGLAAE